VELESEKRGPPPLIAIGLNDLFEGLGTCLHGDSPSDVGFQVQPRPSRWCNLPVYPCTPWGVMRAATDMPSPAGVPCVHSEE